MVRPSTLTLYSHSPPDGTPQYTESVQSQSAYGVPQYAHSVESQSAYGMPQYTEHVQSQGVYAAPQQAQELYSESRYALQSRYAQGMELVQDQAWHSYSTTGLHSAGVDPQAQGAKAAHQQFKRLSENSVTAAGTDVSDAAVEDVLRTDEVLGDEGYEGYGFPWC